MKPIMHKTDTITKIPLTLKSCHVQPAVFLIYSDHLLDFCSILSSFYNYVV